MRGKDGEGVRFYLSVGLRREDIPILILDRWRGGGGVYESSSVSLVGHKRGWPLV